MPQFKVPQNLDLQDRIVGPLTMYQFLYLVIGFMVVYAIFRTGSLFLFVVAGLPIALLALALAFIKINDQPFLKFVVSFLIFVVRPKVNVWHHGQGAPSVEFRPGPTPGPKKVSRKTLDPVKLQEVLGKIEP